LLALAAGQDDLALGQQSGFVPNGQNIGAIAA
jgi:hypothetical protein